MNAAENLKDKIFGFLKNTDSGRALVYHFKKVSGKLPVPDASFPLSVAIETASVCNMECLHCPSHLPGMRDRAKKHGIMDRDLFFMIMDEIDVHGKREIALHKDGEPLLHPDILAILRRVKQNETHRVTLITNGRLFTPAIGQAVLDHQIDHVIFSIGAASAQFYEKVRGKGYDEVIYNVLDFLERRKKHRNPSQVTVQIIRLPEFHEMEKEISCFKEFWKNRDVKIMVYNKLNWGVFETVMSKLKRYPCSSPWRNIFIHWDGKASPCCIDWDQSLVMGNLAEESIEHIWKKSEKLRSHRQKMLENGEKEIPLCRNCDFWSTTDRLSVS